MSMAATEGEFLFISGKSHRLCSSARRDEMMSRERDGKRGETKEYQEGKKHCRASTRESVNDCL